GNEPPIGSEIKGGRRGGLRVVIRGSRKHFSPPAGQDVDVHPVLITAPPDRLAERLAARGREDAQAAAARLQRGDAYEVNDSRLVTIMNDGMLDAAAETLLRFLATLRYSPAVRRRA